MTIAFVISHYVLHCVTTEILFSHWEIMNPSFPLHQYTYSKILSFQIPYCPKNQGSLLELTFSRDVDVPVFESFVTAGTEEPFSGLIFSIVWVLFIPGTLGTEPTDLLAFFILGCLFVIHLQTNLWTPKNVREVLNTRQVRCNIALWLICLKSVPQW